jgi:hypothetical protein
MVHSGFSDPLQPLLDMYEPQSNDVACFRAMCENISELTDGDGNTFSHASIMFHNGPHRFRINCLSAIATLQYVARRPWHELPQDHTVLSGGCCQMCHFTNKALDRHEVSLRSNTIIGLVWWMRWHERRRDWG